MPVAPQPRLSSPALPGGGLMLVVASSLHDKSSVAPFGEGVECCLFEILAAYFCMDLGASRLTGFLS